jgi:hypothetical protein
MELFKFVLKDRVTKFLIYVFHESRFLLAPARHIIIISFLSANPQRYSQFKAMMTGVIDSCPFFLNDKFSFEKATLQRGMCQHSWCSLCFCSGAPPVAAGVFTIPGRQNDISIGI